MMLPPILQVLQRLGHVVFTSGDFNLNLIGIRASDGKPDAFDDLMCVAYKRNGAWYCRYWPITTDPGLYYLLDPNKQLNPLGTAALVEGQYRGVYHLGKHKGYDALVQTGGSVRVYRDNNHDAIIDYDPATMGEGYFGINIHASDSNPFDGGTKVTSKVGAWSAGCQVFQKEADFREFMGLCREQVQAHPTWTSYSYTLIRSSDLRR